MLSRRSKEQLNHAVSNAIVRKMEGFGPRQVGEHAKGNQSRRHDVGPIRRDSRDLATSVEIECAHAVTQLTNTQDGQTAADRRLPHRFKMQGDSREGAAGPDNEIVFGCVGRNDGLEDTLRPGDSRWSCGPNPKENSGPARNAVREWQ